MISPPSLLLAGLNQLAVIIVSPLRKWRRAKLFNLHGYVILALRNPRCSKAAVLVLGSLVGLCLFFLCSHDHVNSRVDHGGDETHIAQNFTRRARPVLDVVKDGSPFVQLSSLDSRSPKPISHGREVLRHENAVSKRPLIAPSPEVPSKIRLPWAGYNLMAQHRPWSSGKCQEYVVKFGRLKQFKPTALASFPCSGNTWMRRLLEQSSGFFTGSVYKDATLQASGFYGEVADVHDGSIIVTKTHQHGEPDVVDFVNGSAILLVRNPFKAILSFHNFLFGGHTGFAPSSNFFRKDWGLFLDRAGENWLRTALDWINLSKKLNVRLLVIHYELLSTDLPHTLTDALHFLELPVDVNRINCSSVARKEDKFKREQGYLPLPASSLFPQPQQAKLEKAIDYLNSVLKSEGLAPLPLTRYEFYRGAPPRSLKFIKCTGELVEQDDCVAFVQKLNEALPKFKLKFRREPRDDDELKRFVRNVEVVHS